MVIQWVKKGKVDADKFETFAGALYMCVQYDLEIAGGANHSAKRAHTNMLAELPQKYKRSVFPCVTSWRFLHTLTRRSPREQMFLFVKVYSVCLCSNYLIFFHVFFFLLWRARSFCFMLGYDCRVTTAGFLGPVTVQ